MPSRSPSVCTTCRTSFKGASTCGHDGVMYMSSKWRAPKKSDDKAWKRIEAGDIWWDKKALSKATAIDLWHLGLIQETIRKNMHLRKIRRGLDSLERDVI